MHIHQNVFKLANVMEWQRMSCLCENEVNVNLTVQLRET